MHSRSASRTSTRASRMPRARPVATRRALTRIVVTKFHPATIVERAVRPRRARLRREPAAGAQREGRRRRRARRTGVALHRAGADQQGAGDPGARHPSSTRSTARSSPTRSMPPADPARRWTCCCRSTSPTTSVAAAWHRPICRPWRSTSPGCRTLRVRGVMAVAPLDEAPAAAFARLHDCSERVRAVVPDATWISAGMTADFAEAIAAGATHLRIGSAITGPRPVPR